VAQNPQQARLIRTARDVNDSKPGWVIGRVKAAVADCLADSGKRAEELTLACFGLAFKPDIDDLRESPSMSIVSELAQWHRGELLAVEPNIHTLPQKLQGRCTLTDVQDALSRADILVLLVDHCQFKAIDGARLVQRYIVDTRGVWR
jgi:UDP-N-acetyl-D-mannosaminuronic acid dehydrogenase